MLPFDQNFYLARKKIWLAIKDDFDNLSNEAFESMKKHRVNEILIDFNKKYIESLFINNLDDSENKIIKETLFLYSKNELPTIFFIKYQNLFQKITKFFIQKKYWYNPLLVIKYVDILEDLFNFSTETILKHSASQKNNEENPLNISDFTIVLNQNLEKSVDRIVQNSDELKEFSVSLSKIIVSIAKKTQKINEQSETVYQQISDVSQSTEQLSQTIEKTAKEITNAATVSQTSKDQAKNAENIVNDLKKTVSRIDEVVLLISEIANQTNLLALNATIESARSGTAGKGFAVVASEVKKLATQTSLATEEIKQKILEVQNHTDQVVDAIHDMNSTIHDINQTTSIIAKSVEEQNITTHQIFSTILELGTSFQKVIEDIVSVDSISIKAEESIIKVSSITQNIASSSLSIKETITNFTEINLDGRDERI